MWSFFSLIWNRIKAAKGQGEKENKKKKMYTEQKREELLEKAKRTLQGDGAVMLSQNSAALIEYCQILVAFRACHLLHKSRAVLREWREVLEDVQGDLQSATGSQRGDSL